MGVGTDKLFEQFSTLNVWKKGDQRAPHKPLVLLAALARVQRGQSRLVSFEESAETISVLLDDFGPARKTQHPEQPFFRLKHDGDFWDVLNADKITTDKDISAANLKRHQVEAGFSADFYRELCEDRAAVNRLAHFLLEEHFPPSMHEDILNAVDFHWLVESTQKKRDPRFRDLILRIYEHRCAICGYDGRLGRTGLAIEAAHVKWHAYGGPDTSENGVALCSFHHKTFDRGALGLSRECRILVSQHVHGSEGVDEWLIRYHGQELRGPQTGQSQPDLSYIEWHQENVFKSPARGVHE